jgi:hypothetical protein
MLRAMGGFCLPKVPQLPFGRAVYDKQVIDFDKDRLESAKQAGILTCGCLKKLKCLPDNSVGLIIASPPYAEQRKIHGGVSNWMSRGMACPTNVLQMAA